MSQVGGLFSRILAKKLEPASNYTEIDASVVGKDLSLGTFRRELAELGYDFEVFADKDGKIYRFRRIIAKNELKDGDVW
jgi:hypothetical protein